MACNFHAVLCYWLVNTDNIIGTEKTDVRNNSELS